MFYEFSLADHVPQDQLLRSIDRFIDLSSIRSHLADFYSPSGRPSIDPELLTRMLLVVYCFGIRSERRLWALPTPSPHDLRSAVLGGGSIRCTTYESVRCGTELPFAAVAPMACFGLVFSEEVGDLTARQL